MTGFITSREDSGRSIVKLEVNCEAEDVVVSSVVYEETHRRSFEHVIASKFGKKRNHKRTTREKVREICRVLKEISTSTLKLIGKIEL